MTKLILGTAEFNPKGYNNEPPPSDSEIKNIFGLAKEAGITIIDTAESYNCQQAIRSYAKGFCIYTKTRDWKVSMDWGNNELRGILYHYQPGEMPINYPFIHRWVNLGCSVYDAYQLPYDNYSRIIQVPFNIQHFGFAGVFETFRTVFVRSVLARGLALQYYSIKECLDFVKKYRPDGIIIGVKSEKELKQILEADQ